MSNHAIHQPQTFGSIFGDYITAADTNQTSEARRLRIAESKLRSWLNDGRSPSVDWVILNARHLPTNVVAELLTSLAAGRFVIEPIDPDEGATGDMLDHVLGLHTLAAGLTREVAAARADGVVTAAEAGRMLTSVRVILVELKRISVSITASAGRCVCRRLAWGRA